MMFDHYKTHADMDIPVEGLELMGYVIAGYEELVEKFGVPLYHDETRLMEWRVKFNKERVARILPYEKQSPVATDKKFWAVEGTGHDVIEALYAVLGTQ
jgi:hypothetical protein